MSETDKLRVYDLRVWGVDGGRVIRIDRPGWFARMRHAWTCGGGWYEFDPRTNVSSCGFCGFRYGWPTPTDPTP